jgi:stearoyl-CoA desaturase (delta-9 desaturase)
MDSCWILVALLILMQHAFPHDYRSGPAKTDWDPSKWIIVALAKLGVAWGLRRATIEDIAAARAHMLANRHDQNAARESVVENKEWTGPTWTEAELGAYIERIGACVVLIDGYAVDVTRYLKAHVRFLSPFMRRICSLIVSRSLAVCNFCVITLSQ